MIPMSTRYKQILTLFVVSVVGAAAGIIHGIFFDLDLSQMGRLSLFGVVFTTVVVFPAILFLEYVFDLNNRERARQLNERIAALEARLDERV